MNKRRDGSKYKNLNSFQVSKMFLPQLILAVASFSLPSFASTILRHERATLPPFFLLVGDSTTHSGSGWGDGFLNKTLLAPAAGLNYGVSGASLPSYRASGEWDIVLAQVAKYKATKEVIVTIQFGHNDQKVPAYEAAFEANLKQFVLDVNNAGGTPVVVTPITRRVFSGGQVIQNLANETAKGIAVASATGCRIINLNKASTAYVNAIGATASHVYNLTPTDDTHLNPWGSVVFGRMVSDLLVAKYADIKAYTLANATLTAELNAGKPA